MAWNLNRERGQAARVPPVAIRKIIREWESKIFEQGEIETLILLIGKTDLPGSFMY